MRTDPPTGDELTRMLTTMKTNVLRRADETMNQPAPARRTRTRVVGISVALVGLLLVGSAGAALATGLIPSPFEAPATPLSTPTPTPVITPTATPNPTSTPTATVPPAAAEPAPDLVAGYNARQLWDMCVARGEDEYPGAVTTADYELRFVHLRPDGVPEVYVGFDTPDNPAPTPVIWICQLGGDTAAPTLDLFNAKDV